MKKLVIKTAVITLCAFIIAAVAVFGLVSFFAPAAMMRMTASLGMTGLSGDYAYQEYERSHSLDYLARAFATSARLKRDTIASDRFALLYGEDGSEARQDFYTFCDSYEVESKEVEISYQSYLCGLAARVKYRLSKGKSETVKEAVCDFALSETDAFTSSSPAAALVLEAVGANDAAFCATYLEKIRARGFEETQTYLDFVKFLEECK